jgi:hypothetical protein
MASERGVWNLAVMGEDQLGWNAEVIGKCPERSCDSLPRFGVGTFESFIYICVTRAFFWIYRFTMLCSEKGSAVRQDFEDHGGIRDEDAKIMTVTGTSCLTV